MLSVNGAFRPQRVSGQQRFAGEIARYLLRAQDVEEIPVPPPLARRASTTWAWVQTGLPVAARSGVLLSLTSRAPAVARAHVVTVHDLFPITHPEWYSRRYLALHRPLLRHHLQKASAIVTVSEPVAEQVRDWTDGRLDPIVAPNAPSRVFSEQPSGIGAAAALERVGRSDVLRRPGYLLAVGSMDPRKNLPRLVRAHAALPPAVQGDFPLVVVGGDWGLFRGGAVDASQTVVRTGYVSDEELAALYRGARAVVFPSLDEGFGLPAVEAAVAGARLVVSDIPVFRWVCGDDATYFDPLDEGSIADALASSVGSVSGAHSRDEVAERVRSRFDWERSSDAVLEGIRTRLG